MPNTKPPKGENITSWKLNILNAACSDDRVTAGEFRMLFLIVRRWNEKEHEITLSDDLIRDEVPDCKGDRTPSRNRKKLRDLGYLQYEPGDGKRGTCYEISDSQVISIEDAMDELREARKSKAKEKPVRKPRKGDRGVSLESARNPRKDDQGVSLESTLSPQRGIRAVPKEVSGETPVHTQHNILERFPRSLSRCGGVSVDP